MHRAAMPERLMTTQDAVLAAGATAVMLAFVVWRADELWHLGTGCVLVSGLVLLVRRQFPTGAFVVATVAATGYYLLDFAEGPAMLGCWVAGYTMASRGDGRRSLLIAGGAIGAMAAIWLTVGPEAGGEGQGWVFFRVASLGLCVALGESIRSRRVIIADAVARAERAEQTREIEAQRRVDAERLRIAREVHDTVAHAIAVINVQSGVTAHLLDRQPERARETLEAIEITSSRALREMRTILGVLSDPHNGRTPHPGIDQIPDLEVTARDAGLEVDLDVSRPLDPLPSAVDSAVYRIIQESITNVIRHVGPARVRVSVAPDGDQLEVRVVNDEGDDDRQPRGRSDEPGRGILGMRERCELLGGEFLACPRPEGGFEVRARLPVAPVGAAP
ncbi:sensor histidine kinase [Nocardioides sp. SYSU DS0651]|uniref:sensor histidine kinase n=1 Tax=Nocardioides sp. SYSU DS0651 TaxID=3415955 RepID=UPI003F4B2381